MISILLIVFLLLFIGINFLAFAFCRSAALADKELDSLHAIQAADLASAITRQACRRVTSDSGAR